MIDFKIPKFEPLIPYEEETEAPEKAQEELPTIVP